MAARFRSERGESLLELLITISILGIAVVAILTGLATAIRLSGAHRDQADAEVIVAAGAESLKQLEYAPCASSYPLSHQSWSLTVTSVKTWDGSAFGDPCSPAATLQLVTIRAASPDGESVETLDVVKRA
jgi:type II secretory pathway pseudopilin PulG